jgi:Protein of unknown function (DUF2752)
LQVRTVSFLSRPAMLALVGLTVGSALQLDWLTSGPSFCPFKMLTGLPCPGCGLTRSAVAFLHGDLSTSAFYHPLGAPMVIAVVLIGIVDAWVWWRSRRSGQVAASPSWLLERLAVTPAPWVAVGALVVVWLVRLPLYVVGVWTF